MKKMLSIGLVALLCSFCFAQTDEQPAETTAPSFGFLQNDRLTGDWGGHRTTWEEQGFTFDFSLTTIYQGNWHGGVRTRDAHRITGSYDIDLSFDFEKMKLWDNGKLWIIAEGGWGDGIDKFVGNGFGVNYDAVGCEFGVTEVWYEHYFFEDQLTLRVGKMDLTRFFDNAAYANDETTQFLNSGLVNNASIPFPDYGQGIQFTFAPTEWNVYFSGAIADDEADRFETGFSTTYHDSAHFFTILEAGARPTWNSSLGELPGNYALGFWYDPRGYSPDDTDGCGIYLTADQLVWRENPGVDGDDQGIGAFLRYGYAGNNPVEHFWSFGGQYRGLIPSRDKDVFGVGFAQGCVRDGYGYGYGDGSEKALEMYYGAEIYPWLTISPSIQWIGNPGGGGRDAVVAGLRLQMSF